MNNNIASIISNDLDHLKKGYEQFVESGFFEKFEFCVENLRPLFSSGLECYINYVLEKFVYSEFTRQSSLLNSLINNFMKFIRPYNQLCVKNKPDTAEDIMQYVVDCLIQDGLVPSFVNSIALNNRLSRIRRNINFNNNWMTNLGIWNYIREKDYWINSDYTSNVTPSSLHVTVDEDLSQEVSTNLEPRSTFSQLKRDFRSSDENPGHIHDACSKHSFQTNNSCRFTPRRKVSRHQKKNKKDYQEIKKAIRDLRREKYRCNCHLEFSAENNDINKVDISNEKKDDEEKNNKEKKDTVNASTSFTLQKDEKPVNKFDKSTSYINVIIKEEPGPKIESLFAAKYIPEKLSDPEILEQETCQESETISTKTLVHSTERLIESQPTVIDAESEPKEYFEVDKLPDRLSLCNSIEYIARADADLVFDIIEKLKLSPYADSNNLNLEMDIQELLCPILCERNQFATDDCSVHSVGMQIESKTSSRKEAINNNNFMTYRDLEIISNFIKKCKCVAQSLNTIEENSWKQSRDGFCLPNQEEEFFLPSSASNFAEPNIQSFEFKKFECLSTHHGSTKRLKKRKKTNTCSQKKEHEKNRRGGKKFNSKKYKHIKKSVLAEFLCLPFTQLFRELVYKILIDKNELRTNENIKVGRKCFCDCGTPDLRGFDSSFKCCKCEDKKSFGKKSQSANDHRLGAGANHKYTRSRTKYETVQSKSKSDHCVLGKAGDLSCRRFYSKYMNDKDPEFISFYARKLLTVHTCSTDRSISHSNSCKDKESRFLAKYHLSGSSRRCRDTRYDEVIDMLHQEMTGMRTPSKCQIVLKSSNDNRLSKCDSQWKNKHNDSCYFYSNSSGKSGRAVGMKRNIGSSSKNGSQLFTARESQQKNKKLSNLMNNQQYVESKVNFEPYFMHKFE